MTRSAKQASDVLIAELEAMTRLLQVGSFCARPDADFESCLGGIAEAAIDLTGASKGNIQLVDEASGSLRIAAHRGFKRPFLDFFAVVRDEPSSCGAAMRSGERTLVEDVTKSSVFADTLSLDILVAEGIYAVQSTPLKSSNGRLVGMLSTHYDAPHRFTETELRRVDLLALQAADFIQRRKVLEALHVLASERESLLEVEQAARVEAERAGLVKDEFLAALSHDLRSTIQAVLGWVRVLQKNPGPEDLKLGLETIAVNSLAQAQLISDLLDMSWIVSGSFRLDVQPIEYERIIDDAIAAVYPAAEARDIRIDKHLDPLTGLSPRGDPARLQQVLWSLLNNAVILTPRGGEIRLFLERATSHVALAVAGTGIVIDRDSIAPVVEGSGRTDVAKRPYGGLRLRLAIVRCIVEAHGGSVRIESAAEGKGAKFVVILPLTVGDEDCLQTR